MTQPRKAGRPCSFTVDYDCERGCQAEFDLADVNVRFTLGQMLDYADRGHVESHLTGPAEQPFRYGGEIIVRAARRAS